MEIRRPHLEIITRRLAEKRRFIQVIAGPRQVGKTTSLRQWMQTASIPHRMITADNVPASDHSWLSQQWQAARLQMQANQWPEMVLIVDEVQKLQNWSEVVKKEWDADTQSGLALKIVLLGSSRLLLQQGLTESLTGRYELIPMLHWTYTEMKAAFGYSAEDYAWFGGYPGPAELVNDERRWKDYLLNSIIEPSISRDILMLTRVDKPALLRQTFELGCLYSGQQLSYNKMIGQLQDAGNTTTLANYLTLLGEAGLLQGLQKYAGSAVSTRNTSPKLQVYNTALMTALTQHSRQRIQQDAAAWGRWVENAVGMHLLNASRQQHFDLWYWRDGNYEIDFVAQKADQLVVIEVKSGNRLKNSGLKRFEKKFGPCKKYLVGADGLSWQSFIEIDPQLLFDA
jgi:predicted AAA+ superfamily ATPase